MAIKWIVQKSHINLNVIMDDYLIPFSEWDRLTGQTFAQSLLLKELIENGQAETDGTTVQVSNEIISALSDIDRYLLELPSFYPFDICVYSKGTLNQSEFHFDWGFYEYPEGKQLFGQRTGCIVTFADESQYLLSSQQLTVCVALDEFNALPPETKSYEKNLLRFADIKKLSQKSAVVLDSYLNNENVIAPKMIRLRPKAGDENTLEIIPEIEGVDNQQFENKFDRFPTIQDVYNIEDTGGKRIRIVHTEEQKEELEKVKNYRRVRGEQKQKILETPQEIFNPDVVDLDLFSQRVIDYGFY